MNYSLHKDYNQKEWETVTTAQIEELGAQLTTRLADKNPVGVPSYRFWSLTGELAGKVRLEATQDAQG